MPAGYEAQIAMMKQYQSDFKAYRQSILDLQKVQSDFAFQLMGLN
jgi:hypothetical protein